MEPAEFPYRRLVLARPYVFSLAGLLVYLILFLAAPIHVAIDFSFWGPLYLFCMYLAFWSGEFFFSLCLRTTSPLAASVRDHQSRKLLGTLLLLICLSWVAEGIWLFDRIYLRGFSLAADVLERRADVADAGSSPLSVLAAMLSGISFITWYIFLLERSRTRVAWIVAALAFICFWFPAINAALFGSRSTVLLSLVLMLLFHIYFKPKRIDSVSFTVLTLALVASLVFFAQTMLSRLELIGLSPLFSLEHSVYAFTLQPAPSLLDALASASTGLVEDALFAISNIAQYYCHGMFELFYQVDHFAGYEHSLGSNTFFIPYKFLALFLELPDPMLMIESARPHYGAFGTFFGPIHSDFGWLGLPVLFLMGVLANTSCTLARRSESWVPLYTYVAAMTFFFPVVNLLVAGTGFYFLFAFVFMGLFRSLSSTGTHA